MKAIFTHPFFLFLIGYLFIGLIVNICLFAPAWKRSPSPAQSESEIPMEPAARQIRKKCLFDPRQERAVRAIRKRLARQNS